MEDYFMGYGSNLSQISHLATSRTISRKPAEALKGPHPRRHLSGVGARWAEMPQDAVPTVYDPRGSQEGDPCGGPVDVWADREVFRPLQHVHPR